MLRLLTKKAKKSTCHLFEGYAQGQPKSALIRLLSEKETNLGSSGRQGGLMREMPGVVVKVWDNQQLISCLEKGSAG